MTDNRLSMNMAKYGKETFTNHDISWKQLYYLNITSKLHINLPWDLSRNNIVVFESILR